jgi:uncharacterized protein
VAANSPDPIDLEPLTRPQILIAMGVTAIVLLLVAKLWMQVSNVTRFPFHLSGRAVLWGIGFALAIQLASAIVYRLWPAYRLSAHYYLEMVIKPLHPVDVVWLGLLPGFSEELLFRGVMLPEFGANWEGIAVSSLCFGALHLSNLKQWPYVVWATVVGAVLGYSAVWSGNLLVPIVAHVLTNLISGALWKWRPLPAH